MSLTDQQLEIVSEAIEPLFQYLEKEVIVDVARRIKKTLTYSRTAELQAMSMRELGYSPAKIRSEAMKILNADPEFRKAVAKNTLEYKREVRDIINSITTEAYKANDEIVSNAGTMSWINDLSVWKDAGKELTDNSFLHQLLEAFAAQTSGELKNMTRTTGFKTMSGYEAVESLYKKELDKAVIKVCSGTFSRDKVLRDMVHELANSGLRSIDFSSGYSMQLDTAARVALRTGCHQLAGKVMDKNIEQSGENLVYVSKHWGARNTGTGHANHEQWQGKVYFIKEGRDYSAEAQRIGQDQISSLYYATGYSVDGSCANDPLGLNGYNCRHSHHPWFVGVSEFPKESPEPAPVTVDGKTYDYYAMTQKMRSMERSVRALKREKEALNALGMDVREIDAQISRKKREYHEFCRTCGISPKNNRLRYECGTANLKKTKAWKNYEEYKKSIVETKKGDIINESKEEKVVDVHTVGKIDKEIYKCITKDIVTDEVVITDNQLQHILDRHPEAYDKVIGYFNDALAAPDYIIKDKRKNTGLIIKNITDGQNLLQMVLRICTSEDEEGYKNSIISCWEISEKRLQNYLRNKEILYKSE
ncbi:MAG: hypothetical protein E7293_03350 [Lachnospiraceae bacterium]|nr:hypothetical protein [Lachnospiraceae bacterium]